MVMAVAGPRRVENDKSGTSNRNVSEPERLVSALAGGALAVYGLKRGGAAGLGLALLGAELVRRGATGHCVLYDAMRVNVAPTGAIPPRADGEIVSAAATVDARKAIKIERSVTIDRPRREMYAVWRRFEHLPDCIEELESVTSLGGGRSHWVARLPGNRRLEWDSEIVNDLPNELVAWKTVGAPDVAHAGSVHFKDALGGRGTELRLEIDYEPPGGKVGAVVASFTRLFGQSPADKIRQALERFKAVMEAGEATTA